MGGSKTRPEKVAVLGHSLHPRHGRGNALSTAFIPMAGQFRQQKTALAEELLIHPMDRDISASLFVCCKLALKCINRELFSGEEKPILSPIYPLNGENFLLSLYPPTEH